LHEHARLRAAVKRQGDQRVGAGLGSQDLQERLGINRDRFGLLRIAVQHRWNTAFAANAVRFVLAKSLAADGFESRFHNYPL
jgi:hypothetical protein